VDDDALGGNMIALIGAGMIVAGFFAAMILLADIDGGLGMPEIVHGILTPIVGLLPTGCVVFLIGLGIWLAHPHVWRF
jgi:hypothetical protein